MVHVVAAAISSGSILKAILRPEVDAKRVFVANAWSRSGADAMAATIMLTEHAPVVLALDAETMNLLHVAEDHAYIVENMRDSSIRTPWKVVWVRPEIEAVLFEDEHLLSAVVGPLSPSERKRARTKPRKVLMETLGQPHDHYEYGMALAKRLAKVDLTPLRRSKRLRPIMTFVDKHMPRAHATHAE